MSDWSEIESTDSESEIKSEESSFTGEEEWISITKNMEFEALKENKKSPPKEDEVSDTRVGCGDEPKRLLSEEEITASNTEETLEGNRSDISVEDTHIRARLRERFLKLLSKLPGQECTINFFENTTQKCTIRACEPFFENVVVEDLTTCYPTKIPSAIIRIGDVISMHIEVDDMARFI